MIRFDGMSPEVMRAMCEPMHAILDPASGSGGLYIGSMSAIQDHDLLRSNRISVLVQVLDVSWLPESEKGIDCYRIEVLDKSSTDLRSHFEGACAKIHGALSSGRNVLVHCQQGISRSPAIVIAYLLRHHGMDLDSALALCKRRRACVKPNSGFVAQLQEWDTRCQGLRAAAASERPGMARRVTSSGDAAPVRPTNPRHQTSINFGSRG